MTAAKSEIPDNQPSELERLRQEARRVSSILNFSPNPVWQRDGELRITFCNLAFTEIAEYGADDVLDMAEIELFKGHRAMARKALETGEEQIDERYVISGGKRRLYRISEVPSVDGSVTGYAVDISETDRAREEVQRHVTAQRDFLESSTSAMAVYGSDQKLQFYNAAYARLWRLSDAFLDYHPSYSEVLEKQRDARCLPEQSNFPAFKQQHLRWFTDLIEPHEDFLYLPDGKTLRMIIIPHALGGLLFAYEDVTDRLALERSYNTLIAVQRETLDNLHEAVIVVGEDGRIKLSNPTFARMWEVDEAITQAGPHIRELMDLCQHFFAVADWEVYKQLFTAQLQERKLKSGFMERTDGSVLAWRMIPLPDGGTLLTYTDVTDSTLLERSLREKNEALEAADRLKSEFLANVSYELRSPLTSIAGFSDILRNNYFGELNDKQREYVEGIHQSSQQLSTLINNILDLASIEAGYMQLELSEFNLYAMIESVLALLKERLRTLGMEIVNLCDPDIGVVYADETRIRQVLFNLLNNAIKYSDSMQQIRVKAVLDGETVVMCVEDQGVGIEPEKLERIFESFTRAGASRGQQSGSGLGLSIVRRFIELHGGTVAVESVVGEGTTFTCRFPKRCGASG